MSERETSNGIASTLTRVIFQLLLFAVLSTLMCGAILAAAYGANHALLLDGPWETAVAVAALTLCLPTMMLAMSWSSTIVRLLFGEERRTARYVVRVSDDTIVSSGQGRPTEKVLWRDLVDVAIVNEDAWPVGSQYWLLIGAGGTGAVVPSEAEGASELLEAMQSRLPGFDSEAVIAAMGSVDGVYRVWKKPF